MLVCRCDVMIHSIEVISCWLTGVSGVWRFDSVAIRVVCQSFRALKGLVVYFSFLLGGLLLFSLLSLFAHFVDAKRCKSDDDAGHDEYGRAVEIKERDVFLEVESNVFGDEEMVMEVWLNVDVNVWSKIEVAMC